MVKFGDRLKQLRMEHGISGAELGEQLGMSKSGISNWEVRHREPSLEMLIKLSNFFGVSIDYLVGKSNFRETFKSLSIDLIKQLITNDTIKDPENIPQEIVEMLVLALKNDLKANKKN